MQTCYRRFVEAGDLADAAEVVVLDIGGADVNGNYREVFDDDRFTYVAADLAPGQGVSIVLDDPYRLPFDDRSVDIVVSGQMLEHCEFFWLAFAEMVRVLKPGGYIFLIAPSAGPIHRYPVDCYRFYPDAYAALAKYTNCEMVDVWRDERGPWMDLVGVFRRHVIPPSLPLPAAARRQPYDVSVGATGSLEEEATGGGAHYLDVLGRIHRDLAPGLYLEIGVRKGASLKLAGCPAVGVDPAPEIEVELPPTTQVFTGASDDFFALSAGKYLEGAPDLTFIDGMHLFEYALRDFMHAERLAGPHGVIVFDDIFPNHPAQGARDRRTRVWAGDVWKLHQVLHEHRPDLFLLPIDTGPTGLLLVAGLDPDNHVLWDRYNPIVRTNVEEVGDPPAEVLAREGAAAPDSAAIARVCKALAAARGTQEPAWRLVARLRQLAAKG